ncbi:hypothetical protein [Kitasatospora sp. Root107]|nr:hypothetical protein [Kitasatospora sp. Root107]
MRGSVAGGEDLIWVELLGRPVMAMVLAAKVLAPAAPGTSWKLLQVPLA